MYKGKIVEQGSVWDIFNNPQHPYTKGLLACRPPLDKRYTFLPTVSDFMQTDDKGNIVDNGVSVADSVYGYLGFEGGIQLEDYFGSVSANYKSGIGKIGGLK